MSVVRIPQPDEDAFPWPRVVVAVVVGGALGLGIAWCGMEADRSAELEGAAATTLEPVEPAVEPNLELNLGAGEMGAEEQAEDQGAVERGADEQAGDPLAVPDASTPLDEPDAAAPAPVPDPRPVEAPAVASSPDPPPATASGVVTLRRGRVAYLRCDGVPQREGPFPCPRDEPLEAAVWSAISEVERCARSPGAGQADLVVDLSAEGPPTIRARDTFPPDVPRTDDAALLACTSESLGNVRSSLSPRRLVVSFRLTLDPSEP